MVFATIMVAANAQKVAKFNSANLELSKSLSLKSAKNSPVIVGNAATFETKSIKPISKTAAAKRAAATDEFAGTFIVEFTDSPDDVHSFTVASACEVSSEVEEGEEYVIVEGTLDGWDVSLVCQLSEDGNTLAVKSSYYCGEDADYGRLVFLPFAGQNYIEDDYLLTVDKDANGNITLSPAEDQAAEGWSIVIAEGQYEGYYVVQGYDMYMNKANATFYGKEKHIENSAWTGWADAEAPVAVEKLDGMVLVHNMFGTVISLEMEDANAETFAMPNGQDVTYGKTQAGDVIVFTTYNMYVDEEGYYQPAMLSEDDDCAPDPTYDLTGFHGLTEEGNEVFEFLFYDEVDQAYYHQALYVAKFLTSAGNGYFKNFWRGMSIECDAVETDGINDVVAQPSAMNATYNLAGQQVSKNYKGIVINGGKKFLNK